MNIEVVATGIISALTAAGGVGGLFQIKENRRAKKIENDKAAANEWKELYEKSDAKCETLGQKIDSVYTLFRQEQEKTRELEIALERTQIFRCDKVKCAERRPPFMMEKTENN